MNKTAKEINFDVAVEGYEEFSIADLQLLPRTKKQALSEGLELYFDGFCNRGHLAIRHVNHGRCIKCVAKDKRKHYDANKEDIIKKAVQYLNRRYKNDNDFKAQKILRFQVTRLISVSKLQKTTDTETIVGYSSIEFKSNMESKFEEGMTWENYGTVWQIDHVKPIAMFHMSDLESLKEVNSLDNLVPMFNDKHRIKTASDLVAIIEYKKNLLENSL